MQNDLSPEAQEALARARRCGLPVVLGLGSMTQVTAAYADTPVAPLHARGVAAGVGEGGADSDFCFISDTTRCVGRPHRAAHLPKT